MYRLYYLRINTTSATYEQELFTLPGHLSSSPVFSGVHVVPSLVIRVDFVDLNLSFFF